MANKKTSALNEHSSSTISDDWILGIHNPAVASYKLKFSTLKAWIIAQLTSFATQTGFQTLTNKTLTLPRINSGTEITVTGAKINLLDGASSNIQDQIDTVSGNINLISADIDDLNDRVIVLEGNTVYKVGMGIYASASTHTINAATIDPTRTIDPTTVVVTYYQLNGINRFGQASSGIQLVTNSGQTALSSIVLTVTSGKNYLVYIQYEAA